MNIFGKIFLIVWSLAAITVGIMSVFFREWSVRLNIKWGLFLYRKSGFSYFKWLAEKIEEKEEAGDLDLITIIVGALFIYFGIKTFLSIF